MSYTPNFDNLLKTLRREKAEETVLFELFMNQPFYEYYAGRKLESDKPIDEWKLRIDAFKAAGYDYTTVHGSNLSFDGADKESKETISLNDAGTITDWESFEKYTWPNPDNYDYSMLEKIEGYLPDGMKLIVMGPGGVLENVIALVGYDNLCFMLFDEPELVKELFDNVGKVLLGYYKNALEYSTVGAIVSNDDWGFNTQTFLSVPDMQKYVFPWHKEIVKLAHKAGRPAILHSCGYMHDVMDFIIDDMKFDGKHSYEDNIFPVEDSYKKWGDRIAIMGGLDLDFLIKSPDEVIRERCLNILKLTEKGGYALGTGNSVPEYLPIDKYQAMAKSRDLI